MLIEQLPEISEIGNNSLQALRKRVEEFAPEVDRVEAIRNTYQWLMFSGGRKQYDDITNCEWMTYIPAEYVGVEVYTAAKRFLDALALPFPEGAISRIEEILRRFLVAPIDEKTSGWEAFSVYDINPSLIRGNELPPNPREWTLKYEEELQIRWAENLRNMSPEEIAALAATRYVVGRGAPIFFARIARARGSRLHPWTGDIGQTYWFEFDGRGEDLVYLVNNPSRIYFHDPRCKDKETFAGKFAYLLTSVPSVVAGATPEHDKRIFS